ncbi:MAG: sugar transporter [Proteobacteria bacterium]|nr:MAG: sugar transporter [Pseudomonadota bacterium]
MRAGAVRVARMLQVSAVLAVALAVSGCMRPAAPVLAGPSIDALAYNGGVAAAPPVAARSGRGLFGGAVPAPLPRGPAVAAPSAPPPVVSGLLPATPDYAVPTAVAAAVGPKDYRVDGGDKLRVVVYGQEGLTNTYAVGANGSITMPLIGAVAVRGLTPAGVARVVTARLRDGFIRDPSVAVEVDTYRPFFILGEVAAPGQYPYVPNMTVESAVAIAGGFTPRARHGVVQLTRSNSAGSVRADVPIDTPLHPGDSIVVGERWF